jgi:hypothetical protein
MNDEKVTKAKLYTYAEMKDAVAQAIADMAVDSASDSDYDEPAQMALAEALVGAKILAELEKKHRKGEL